jgi:hypothetical protein
MPLDLPPKPELWLPPKPAIVRAASLKEVARSTKQASFLPGMFPSPIMAGKNYVAEVLADAPNRYYRLGELSGTTAVDYGSDAVDGVYNNTPTLGEPSLVWGGDGAVSFTAASSEFVSASVLSSPVLPITVECWFKPAVLSGNQGIVNLNRDTGNYRGIILYISGGDDLGLNLGDGNGSSAGDRRTYVVADAFVVGNIYHYVAVVNSHTSVEMWLNGVQQSPSSSGSAGVVATVGGTFAIGASSQGNGYANGMVIDEVAVYNGKALAAARIEAHYRAGRM